MPKRIEPVMGTPVKKYLFEKDENDVHNDLIVDLYESVNVDVCMNDEQLDELEHYINYQDGSNDDTRTISYELLLSTFINSFRLDCANCLNGECKMRDPEIPVPEVPHNEEK